MHVAEQNINIHKPW